MFLQLFAIALTQAAPSSEAEPNVWCHAGSARFTSVEYFGEEEVRTRFEELLLADLGPDANIDIRCKSYSDYWEAEAALGKAIAYARKYNTIVKYDLKLKGRVLLEKL